MLAVFIDGAPIAGAASIRYTTTIHGSGTASWRMDPDRAPELAWALDKRVHIRASGSLLWAGHLAEPGAEGEYHAVGIPALAEKTPAVNAAGEPITGEATAIIGGVDRGALDGWQKGHDPMPGGLGGDPQPGMTVATLLNGMADNRGLVWAVTPDGVPYAYPTTPGAPDWHVTVPGYRYGYDTTDLATHLYGRYMAGVGTFAYTSVAADGVIGVRREEWLDLTREGIMDAATARQRLRDIARAQGKSLPSPTTPITARWGDLTTPGGTAVPPWMATTGETLRVWGATDGRTGAPYLDARIGETAVDDDEGTNVVQLLFAKPRGFAATSAQYVGD